MGQQRHRLSEIDPRRRTANCRACGPVGLVSAGRDKLRCGVAYREEHRAAKLARRERMVEARGTVCERCGFEPEDLCQLGTNHTEDGDQTLCANCQRLVLKVKLGWRDRPN